jgi:CheY-like chemotaxis protein/chemotaxis signal transduction protein
VSLPHLLVVDDSEAILSYQTAALSSHYTVSTATNGRQALEKLRKARPAAVLLDLSMPEMTGDELLERMQADPALSAIPVIVVSSEKARGEASLQRGARAYLPKPIRAQEILRLVARVLDEERRRTRSGELAVVFLGVGPLELAMPLDPVRAVLPQLMTQAMPMGPNYLCEMIDYRGLPVFVLDLALRLNVPHLEPLHERKLIVCAIGDRLLAISVDRVRDPEVFPAADVLLPTQIGGTEHPPIREVLLAIVKTQRGAVPVIDPHALLSAPLLDRLVEALQGPISSEGGG